MDHSDFRPPAMSGGLVVYQEVPVLEGDLNINALVSATEAAEYAGVSVAAVCNWRARGILPVATGKDGREIRDNRGRPRYRLLDVAKAENATKQRGEQMARQLRRAA